MSIRPAYQSWWRNGLTYLPVLQFVGVMAVPPEVPPPHVPELAPVGARAVRAIADTTAAAAIPALVRMVVNQSPSSAGGVSCRAGAEEAALPRSGFAPNDLVPPLPDPSGSGIRRYRAESWRQSRASRGRSLTQRSKNRRRVGAWGRLGRKGRVE